MSRGQRLRRSERPLNYCTLWVDAGINTSEENRRAQEKLRMFVRYLYLFTDQASCLQYIQSLSNEYPIILIVSGELGQSIVPEISHLQKVVAIYVFCSDKQHNDLWARHYFKIRGVVNQFEDLIDCLRPYQVEQGHRASTEEVPMKISNLNEEQAEQSSTSLNGQFLHFQLFIDCLIRLKPSDDDQSELIAACRQWYQHDSEQLRLIDEFAKSYSADRAIWWYTRESFVYHLVNRALRRQDIHQLYLFRSFIRDLGRQLQVYRSHPSMRVYRAQRMCKKEIAALQQSVGRYISMNSFLSTSLNQARTRAFLLSNFCSKEHEQVFFEIHADPGSDLGQVFSSISSQSFVPREEEVIFMIGSIFQLVQMERDEAGLWRISLLLCSNQEKYLQQLPKGDPHIALCYHAMGCVADSRGDDQTSLNCYRKCLAMSMETDKPDQFNLATTHNSMAVVYRKKGDSVRSLASFERALSISMRTFGEDDVNVAMCLNNMGGLHSQEKNYEKALECYQKALVIWQKHLPADHSDLGALFNNIGGIYHCLGQYHVALASYKISLDIKLKSLPDKHPDIAVTLKNIGLVYERGGHPQKALKHFQQVAKIYGESPSGAHIQDDIRRVSFIEQ